MPSVEEAAFKAHPETICAVLNGIQRGLHGYPPGGVPLLSLRNLTLSTFVGSYTRFDESSIPRSPALGDVPHFLGRVCTSRALARKRGGRDDPQPLLGDFGLEGTDWKTFNIIELRGIHCNSEGRQTLAKYVDELIVDDPFDLEVASTASPGSDGYYSSEEEELWLPSSGRASEDGDSQKWHSSSASYTDEADIDEETEGSVDEDVDEDAETDDLNINTWGLAEVPSELDDDEAAGLGVEVHAT